MSPEDQRSNAERARRVEFGKFTRTRSDDRVVELFLAWWQEGRWTARPEDWLPQNVTNVEVIAKDAAGRTLAVEHTSIHAFVQHEREEKWLDQIAEQIEAAGELQLPGRRSCIILSRDVFDDLNAKKREEYTCSLIKWLAEILPGLSKGTHRLTTPSLLRNKRPFEVVVEVDEFLDGLRPVSVIGMLPGDATKRAAPQVEHVLESKLPKLSNAKADYKVLLVELPTWDTSPTLIVDLIRSSLAFTATAAPRCVDYIVAVKTIKIHETGTAWFFAYDARSYEANEIGCVTWS